MPSALNPHPVSPPLERCAVNPLLLAAAGAVQIIDGEERGHGSSLGPGLTYVILVLQQGLVPVPVHTGQGGKEGDELGGTALSGE